MKRIVISSLVLLFGLAAILGGVSKLGSSQVDCGGQTMYSGQSCVTSSVSGSETGRSSYEDQKKSSNFGTWAAMGLGGIIALIGADNLRIGIRNLRRKKSGETPAADPAAAPQAWNQPDQGWRPAQSDPNQVYTQQPQTYPQQMYPQQQAYPQQTYQQPPPSPQWQQPQQQYPQQPQHGWGPPPHQR